MAHPIPGQMEQLIHHKDRWDDSSTTWTDAGWAMKAYAMLE